MPSEEKVISAKVTTFLELHDAEKEYKDFHFGPMNVSIHSGKTYALLGQNGAGKTTFLQLITGNTDASAGQIRLNGERFLPDHFEAKREMGYLPQHMELPNWVTGEELLSYAARLYGMKDPSNRVEERLKHFDAQSFRNRPLATCSHGMRKRIGLCLATLHDPKFLILDEPFSGLDLLHTKALEQEIQQRRARQKTTLICTHIAPYAARLCEEAIGLRRGQLVPLAAWNQASPLDREKLIDHLMADA